eukprot:scaffold15567_cov28-Prasinocladus_malaysianus.AAC.1
MSSRLPGTTPPPRTRPTSWPFSPGSWRRQWAADPLAATSDSLCGPDQCMHAALHTPSFTPRLDRHSYTSKSLASS